MQNFTEMIIRTPADRFADPVETARAAVILASPRLIS
jgi:hypothetical protein